MLIKVTPIILMMILNVRNFVCWSSIDPKDDFNDREKNKPYNTMSFFPLEGGN